MAERADAATEIMSGTLLPGYEKRAEANDTILKKKNIKNNIRTLKISCKPILMNPKKFGMTILMQCNKNLMNLKF